LQRYILQDFGMTHHQADLFDHTFSEISKANLLAESTFADLQTTL
jgi:hypothetical protein